MRLYIEEKISAQKTGSKKYLDKLAGSRSELKAMLGAKDFYIDGQKYNIDQVKAEVASDSTALGLAIGGVLGMLAGTPGVVVGGAFGALLGRDKYLKEVERVRKFNESKA